MALLCVTRRRVETSASNTNSYKPSLLFQRPPYEKPSRPADLNRYTRPSLKPGPMLYYAHLPATAALSCTAPGRAWTIDRTRMNFEVSGLRLVGTREALVVGKGKRLRTIPVLYPIPTYRTPGLLHRCTVRLDSSCNHIRARPHWPSLPFTSISHPGTIPHPTPPLLVQSILRVPSPSPSLPTAQPESIQPQSATSAARTATPSTTGGSHSGAADITSAAPHKTRLSLSGTHVVKRGASISHVPHRPPLGTAPLRSSAAHPPPSSAPRLPRATRCLYTRPAPWRWRRALAWALRSAQRSAVAQRSRTMTQLRQGVPDKTTVSKTGK